MILINVMSSRTCIRVTIAVRKIFRIQCHLPWFLPYRDLGVASLRISGLGSLLRSQSARTAVTQKLGQDFLMVGKLVPLHMGFSVKLLNGLLAWRLVSPRESKVRDQGRNSVAFSYLALEDIHHYHYFCQILFIDHTGQACFRLGGDQTRA